MNDVDPYQVLHEDFIEHIVRRWLLMHKEIGKANVDPEIVNACNALLRYTAVPGVPSES